MRISDEQLNYWADKFCDLNLRRYMSFATFIQRPELHLQRVFNGSYRPLLKDQLKVRDRLAALGRHDMIERLENKGVLTRRSSS